MSHDLNCMAFEAIGTRWTIQASGEMIPAVREAIRLRINTFDQIYSRFRADSLVTQIATARGGGQFEFPAEASALFDLYDELFAATEGAVDPLIGRRLELLGYDAAYSLRLTLSCGTGPGTREVTRRRRWDRDVSRDGRVLTTREPLTIDLGAAGKGYLVDLVADILYCAGLDSFVVDGSGDLRHAGVRGVRVGLEHPDDPQLMIGVANLSNQSLCASAVNRRAWGPGLHHIVNAGSGSPTNAIVATWVVADSAAVADGVATALFFTEPYRLSSAFAFTYVRMLSDGRAEFSQDFDGELFF